MITPEEIIDKIGIHRLKVKNIYMFGSRVYGNYSENSDYDILVVANSMNESVEHRIGDLNIHVHIPDKFIRDLHDLDMHNLECVFAPDFAKIQEKVLYGDDKNFKDIVKNKEHLAYKSMNQSYNSFHKAKLKINGAEFKSGVKSLFHSMRILVFANQIKEHGIITDYSAANHFWDEIKKEYRMLDDIEYPWTYLKEKYLPLKIELEKELKS